jgi:hypothetical protein
MGDIRSHFRFRFLFLRDQIKLPIVPNCGWEGEPQFPARKKFHHHPLSGWPRPSGQTMITKSISNIKHFSRAFSLMIAPASSGEYGSSHVHSENKADEKPCHENHIHRTQLGWIKQITIHLTSKIVKKEINRATPGNGDWGTRVSKRKENASLLPGWVCVCVQVRKKRGRDRVKERGGVEWENDRCSSRQSPWESARKREGPS